jgi:hypothetical protein
MRISQVRLLPVMLLFVSSVHGQDALALLHRMQTALGGPRLASVRDVDWIVRAKVFDGDGHDAGIAVRRIRVILPYEFRKDQDMFLHGEQAGPTAHTRFYFNGHSGWGTFADVNGWHDRPITPLSGHDLEMVRREVRGFWLNIWRADGNGDFSVSVCAPHTLRFVDKSDSGNSRVVELDPVSWLPDPKTTRKPLRDTTTAWILIDGVELPQRMLHYQAGHLVAEISTVSAKINSGLKSNDLAKRPAEQ